MSAHPFELEEPESATHPHRRTEAAIQHAERYCEKHTNEFGVGTEAVGIIRQLIMYLMQNARPETEWEYSAGYLADAGYGPKWFSMEPGGYRVREAAENLVKQYGDPQIVLVRRRSAGAWEESPA